MESKNTVEMQAICNAIIDVLDLTGRNYDDVAANCTLPDNRNFDTLYSRLTGRRGMPFIALFDVLANGMKMGEHFAVYNKTLPFIYKPK